MEGRGEIPAAREDDTFLLTYDILLKINNFSNKARRPITNVGLIFQWYFRDFENYF